MSTLERPAAIFQTVSEGLFSEVRLEKWPPGTVEAVENGVGTVGRGLMYPDSCVTITTMPGAHESTLVLVLDLAGTFALGLSGGFAAVRARLDAWGGECGEKRTWLPWSAFEEWRDLTEIPGEFVVPGDVRLSDPSDGGPPAVGRSRGRFPKARPNHGPPGNPASRPAFPPFPKGPQSERTRRLLF
jgi:hypothetical protein